MPNATATLLSDDYSTSKQGWTREATYKLAGHKVRATIYRDSYNFQSRLFVEVWSPSALAWNMIQSLSGSDYPDLPSSATKRPALSPAATQPIVDALISYARKILS